MTSTVAEIRGQLVSVTDGNDPALDRIPYNIKLQPSIHIIRDLAPIPTSMSADEATPKDDNILTNITNFVCQQVQDVGKTLEENVSNTPFYDASRIMSEIVERWTRQQPEVDQPPKNQEAIRSIAWHPHRNMIALADENDAVYIYERAGSEWKCSVLRHTFMRDISCIEWKKRTRGTLAVGCRKGVCVWNIGSESDNKTDVSAMNYLCSPGHENISSVAWDPTPGSHLLAAASGTTSTIVVYDTLTLSTMPVKRAGNGNLLLRWSPNGRWLYVATKSGTSRMWDTLNWRYRELNNPPGLWVQSACWAPDSKSLFLSMHGKSDVHLVYWPDEKNGTEVCHEKIYPAQPSIDSVAGDDKCFTVGDSIKELALCPETGRRLAVIFQKSNTVAWYAVDIDSPLALKCNNALTKIGNVQGALVNLSSQPSASTIRSTENRKPVHISLSPRFSSASTLATLYDDGTVSFMAVAP